MLKRLCVCASFALVGLSSSVSADVAMVQGQVHEERYELPARHFVTLEVVQYDIDLDARVLDPGGTEVIRGAIE